MPLPNRESRGRTVLASALILGPSDACPIPAGAVGYWVDQSRTLKLRDSKGADASLARGASAVLFVRAKTAAPLPTCTYTNGDSGVGATLTADANGALPAQGGVTLLADDYVLVDHQAAGLQNGIYRAGVLGSGGAPFVLTRAAEFDEAGEVRAGVLVIVQEGTFAGRIYQLTAAGTIGTDPLTFAEPPSGLVVKTKHAFAVVVAQVGGASHQANDVGVAALQPLAGGANLATAGARFTALRAALLSHFASVGNATADGAHKTADTLSGGGLGTDVSSLPNLITRIGELKNVLVAHATQVDVHYASDAALVAITISVDPPVTQANCNADLNDLLSAMQNHFTTGVDAIFA